MEQRGDIGIYNATVDGINAISQLVRDYPVIKETVHAKAATPKSTAETDAPEEETVFKTPGFAL